MVRFSFIISVVCASIILCLSSCVTEIEGCTDTSALNFNIEATQNCCCEYASDSLAEWTIQFKHSIQGDSAERNVWFSGDSAEYSISLWRYYLSNFYYVNTKGLEIPFSDTIVFIDGFQAAAVLLQSAPDSIMGFGFHWGIDSLRNNTSQPNMFPASHPLGAKSPSMYWSWATDYLFCKVEGKYRKNGEEGPITWHIGRDAAYGKAFIPVNQALSAESANVFVLEADLNTFANVLELPEEAQTHTSVTDATTKKFKTYFPSMFRLK